MKVKATWVVVSVLIVASMAVISCADVTTTETAVVTQTTTVTSTSESSTQGQWWEKYGTPKYGGTLTLVESSLQELFDPYFNGANADYCEHTFRYDMTLDRDIWAFKIGWAPTE